MKRIWSASIVYLLILSIIVGAFVWPHLTKSHTVHAQSSRASAEPNCVAFTEPVLHPGTKNHFDLKTVKGECYSTYAEAILTATGGKVHLPKNMDPGDAAHQMIESAMNQPTYSSPNTFFPFMELFQNSNYGGQNITHSDVAPPCSTSGQIFSVSQIGVNNNGFNMNDQASSFQLFGSCVAAVLYTDHNWNNDSSAGSVFSSSHSTQVPLITGPMNDQASSFVVADSCQTLSNCLVI